MADYLNWDDPQFGTKFGGIGGPNVSDPRAAQDAPAGSININPGNNPDFPYLIAHDPGYLAAQAAATAAAKTSAAQRRETIRQALIQYGGNWAGFTDKYGDIDQATRDLAAANQNSTLAQLARNLATNTHNMRAQLAARGMLESGDLGYGQNQLQTNYAQDQYNAGLGLGQTLTGAVNAYTGVLNQNAKDLWGALMTATANEQNAPGNQVVKRVDASYDPGASTKAGKFIYRDPDGNYYTADGKPYYP